MPIRRQKNNHAAHKPRGYHILYGGDKEDRTPDLLHAMQALSQLSYAPVFALPLTTDIIIEDAEQFVKHFFAIYLDSSQTFF